MKRWLNRRNFLYGMIAMAGFVLLYAATFRGHAESERLRQVQMVAFGDSVFTDLGELTPVPERLSERMGMSVYNASMGGTCAARMESQRKSSSGKETLSLAGLTKSIRGKDFSVQQSAKIRDSNTERFPEIVDGLAEIDFDSVELVLIQKGVNDYHAGVTIDNPKNPYDEYTFLGALRSAVEDLRRRNPELRILLITPTYTWYMGSGQTCEEVDNGGGLLEDYVEAELRLAEELDVDVVDLYHDFYPHVIWEDWERYTLDGIHPNEAGREKMTQAIAELLRSEGTYRTQQ